MFRSRSLRNPGRRGFPRWIVLLPGLLLLTCILAGCGLGGVLSLGKPLVNLPPLTPAKAVPLAQLKWCKGVTPSQPATQPSFTVQLPTMLSADYCLSQVDVSTSKFDLSYKH